MTSHDPVPDPLEVQGEVRAQNPQISANATLATTIETVDVPFGFDGSDGVGFDQGPFGSVIDPLEVQGEVRAQNPQISANATLGPHPGTHNASGTVQASDPVVSAAAGLGSAVQPLAATGTVTAANPSISAAATIVAVPTDLAGAGTDHGGGSLDQRCRGRCAPNAGPMGRHRARRRPPGPDRPGREWRVCLSGL